MKQRYILQAVSKFKGDVEGKHYDNTKAVVFYPNATYLDTQSGCFPKIIEVGNSEVYSDYIKLKMPCLIDLEIVPYIDKNMKEQQKVSGFTFIREVDTTSK